MILCRARVFKPARMFSTLVGRSGREYTRRKLLQHNPSKPNYDIYLASAGRDDEGFVIKPVTPSIFELMQELKDEFGSNHRLRHHIDENEKENVLVYEYFKADLFTLVQKFPALPKSARKTILKEVGLALKDLHAKNWIHLDVKPHNIFLNFYLDEKDLFHLDKLELGDMDCALKLDGERLLNAKIGNVMWRSPEGQLGKGVGKPSEVFSFGLLFLWVTTGVQCFSPDIDVPDAKPEDVVLFKLLRVLGPLPDALVKHVDDKEGGELLEVLWEDLSAEAGLTDPFEAFSEERFPNLDSKAKRLIMMMTNLDPAKRASMSDIMMDSYWNGVEGVPAVLS